MLKGVKFLLLVCGFAMVWWGYQNLPRPAFAQSTPTQIVYVATDGRDTWTGRLPEPNATRTDGPFATITRAQAAVRQLRASSVQPITVLVRGGIYELTETIVFFAADSGSAEAPVTYANYPGETVVFSGGRAIRGWRKLSDNLWTASIPEVVAGQWYFRQLFVNGQRRTRARTPNEGYLYTAGFWPGITDPRAQQGHPMAKLGFRYRAGDLKRWDNFDDVNLILFHSWTTSIHYIQSLNETDRTVLFTAPSESVIGYYDPSIRFRRYYVENFLEALDAPEEWYLDRARGVLYYWPLESEDMTTAAVVAPLLQRLVEFRGNRDRQVQYITLRGLSFQYADWSLARDKSSEGGYPFRGAIDAFQWTRNLTIEDCEIAHVGEYGLSLLEPQDSRVVKLHAHDLGAGGIKITGFSTSADRNVVDNSFLHDGGHVFASAYGLLIHRGSYSTVSHNEISDFFNNGINVSGFQGYGPSLAHHNSIEFNRVHHIGQGVLSDFGGIYTLGESPGTALRNNLVHDLYAYTYGAHGLYTDEASSDILLENNIVYNTATGFNQNFGREDVIRNNIFTFAREAQINRGRQDNHLSFTFERNIVVLDNGQMFAPNFDGINYRFEDNLYWDVSGAEPNFAGLSFREWQATGQDRNSLIADPLFADLRSWTLQPQSPAFRVGFQPIDTSTIGLYGDPAWVGLPRRVERAPRQISPTPGYHYIEEDFEQSIIGDRPGWGEVSGEEKGASIRVSDETAASGRRSAKFTDAAGLSNPGLPQLNLTGLYLAKDSAHFSLDLRLEAGAGLTLNWRDLSRLSPNDVLVGPSIRIQQNGDLVANGRTLMKLPQGQWIHFDLLCVLGVKATGTYDLAVTLPGQDPRRFSNLPLDSPRFKRLIQIGFSSSGADRAIFYLDNLRLVTFSTRRRP